MKALCKVISFCLFITPAFLRADVAGDLGNLQKSLDGLKTRLGLLKGSLEFLRAGISGQEIVKMSDVYESSDFFDKFQNNEKVIVDPFGDHKKLHTPVELLGQHYCHRFSKKSAIITEQDFLNDITQVKQKLDSLVQKDASSQEAASLELKKIVNYSFIQMLQDDIKRSKCPGIQKILNYLERVEKLNIVLDQGYKKQVNIKMLFEECHTIDDFVFRYEALKQSGSSIDLSEKLKFSTFAAEYELNILQIFLLQTYTDPETCKKFSNALLVIKANQELSSLIDIKGKINNFESGFVGLFFYILIHDQEFEVCKDLHREIKKQYPHLLKERGGGRLSLAELWMINLSQVKGTMLQDIAGFVTYLGEDYKDIVYRDLVQTLQFIIENQYKMNLNQYLMYLFIKNNSLDVSVYEKLRKNGLFQNLQEDVSFGKNFMQNKNFKDWVREISTNSSESLVFFDSLMQSDYELSVIVDLLKKIDKKKQINIDDSKDKEVLTYLKISLLSDKFEKLLEDLGKRDELSSLDELKKDIDNNNILVKDFKVSLGNNKTMLYEISLQEAIALITPLNELKSLLQKCEPEKEDEIGNFLADFHFRIEIASPVDKHLSSVSLNYIQYIFVISSYQYLSNNINEEVWINRVAILIRDFSSRFNKKARSVFDLTQEKFEKEYLWGIAQGMKQGDFSEYLALPILLDSSEAIDEESKNKAKELLVRVSSSGSGNEKDPEIKSDQSSQGGSEDLVSTLMQALSQRRKNQSK